jgi:two-component system LytT family sensor kinase
VEINSRPGRGTKVTLLMPILDAGAEAWGPIGGTAGQALGHLVQDAVRAMTRG